MQTWLKTQPTLLQGEILEAVRNHIAKSGLGVTLVDGFLTVRGSLRNVMYEVSLTINTIEDGRPMPEPEDK